MAPGDGLDEASDFLGDSPTSEPADAPSPRRRGIDPSVETVWLGQRTPRPTLRRPRLSTVLLLVAFVALLVLYALVRPAG